MMAAVPTDFKTDFKTNFKKAMERCQSDYLMEQLTVWN
jgi:hypothetical protein